jgi:calcineurin-like phosphoesterase family protein
MPRTLLALVTFGLASSAANGAMAYSLGFVSDFYEKCTRDPRSTDPATKIAKMVGGSGVNAVLATEVNNCNGTVADYRDRIDKVWSPLKNMTHAVPGNHDFSGGEAGFKYYFGDSTDHAYSVTLGGTTWKIIGLDSNTAEHEADDPVKAFYQRWFLWQQLSDEQCSIVYFHHPRWSSGSHGSNEFMDSIWRIMAQGNVELAISGHDHHFERFWPMDADGNRVSDGLTQVVAGTGGVAIRDAGSPIANSIEIFDGSSDHGSLYIYLYEDQPMYFVGYVAPDGSFKSYWWGTCH